MTTQEELNYNRIADAIMYIKKHFKEQPSLNQIAQEVHLSPFHFQRLFKEWAGTTPKKFLQYTSIQHAKALLKKRQATLFDTAMETGLSGTGRLHDLFINIEGMSPAEYKNGGKNLVIRYRWTKSPFGNILVASTPKGICYMAFYEDEKQALVDAIQKFPNAKWVQKDGSLQRNALSIFQGDENTFSNIKLHLKGSEFQLKVWEMLLKIPMGQLATYGDIAAQVGKPNASRAVGTAIGSNPIAFLIPCHRVIQSSGNTGGYMWGTIRKTAIIAWESAKCEMK